MDLLYSLLELLLVVGLIAIPILIKVFRTRCIKCTEKYTPKDMVITASDLKWERKREERHGTTGGFMSATGTNYVEFTDYKVFYRIVTFGFKCSKCNHIRTWTKKYVVYDGRSNRSQSKNEEIAVLKKKIAKTLGKKFLGNAEIKIKNIDY